MRPIKIYFAGSWAAPEECATDVRHRLVSHAYPSQFKNWLKMNPEKEGEIILDSGAFSAWTKGEKLDIHSYIELAHEIIEKGAACNKKVHVVNIDVIPGKVGETKDLNAKVGSTTKMAANKRIKDEAASKGFDNLKTMVENGITPIHVFHQGEDFTWLDKMTELTDYIGVSPANDLRQTAKHQWMESVFEYLYKRNIDIKTHGFAVTAFGSMKELPWYSCDSTSWRMPAGFGQIIYPAGGFVGGKQIKQRGDFSLITVSERSGGRGVTVKDETLKLLQRDGYSYEDLQDFEIRAKINLRFYLKLEKDLNKYKMTKKYKPRRKIL